MHRQSFVSAKFKIDTRILVSNLVHIDELHVPQIAIGLLELCYSMLAIGSYAFFRVCYVVYFESKKIAKR